MPRTDEVSGRPADLSILIDRWLRKGLITAAQAGRLRADLDLPYENAVPAEPVQDRASLVVEALGYVGGVVILIAAGLLAARFWPDLSTGVRLGVVGGAALALFAAGLAMPHRQEGAGLRLHTVLWLLSTGSTAAFLGLFANEVLDLTSRDVGLVTSAGTAIFAGVLWWRLRTAPQQVALFAALMFTAGTATARLDNSDNLPGVAVWGVGVVWFLLGWGGLVAPRKMVYALSAAGTLVGALMTVPTDAGLALGLATVVAIVATAVLFRDLLLLAVGTVGALQILPAAVTEWFPGDLAAPLALLILGALLVTAAIYIARHRPAHQPAGRVSHDRAAGSARPALMAASAVAVAVSALILSLAL